MNLPDPGHRKNESKEEGMRRRKKEGDRKSHKLWLEITRIEQEQRAMWRSFVDASLPDYEDLPLGGKK